MTTFVAEYRPLLLVLAFGLLAVAFYLTYRSRRRSRAMVVNKVMLWVAAIVGIGFLFFPQVMNLAADDEFTPDMQRTVIAIEGMT